MSIEFNLDVSASDEGLKFMLLENEEIQAQYVDGSVIISRTIINEDYDEIVITDGLLSQPDTLNLKILNLLAKVSDVISGIENFFSDGGNYFFKLNLGSDFSIIDFYRNTVDNIQGQFTTKTNPSAGIFVRDMTINEGESKPLCFFRMENGDTSQTTFNLSFTERDRPGRGGISDDFELSDSSVTFQSGEYESCITFTAKTDVAFDWVHEIMIDISSPTNGQELARDQVKIRIVDQLGETNRISGIQNIY
jgi:hypothetical protein